MTTHSVECCPDDLGALRERLDEIAREGARIIAVIWQPQPVDPDQAALVAGRGSFVIVSQAGFDDPLREKAAGTDGEGLLSVIG